MLLLCCGLINIIDSLFRFLILGLSYCDLVHINKKITSRPIRQKTRFGRFHITLQNSFTLLKWVRHRGYVMIKTLSNREWIPICGAVEDTTFNYEESLRKAFQKPRSLINDLGH